MTDVGQQMQQKPESTSNGCDDFECGFEDLMRGHLDDCMSFTSCSSPRNTEDEDNEGDQLVRRRRRSDLEGDDLAESSAARRRHSQILSRWAARQAQEMITTIERRNRESELMALAGLHTVSMLDSSFLRESQSPTSRRQGNVERPNTQASSILQMWRELEDAHALNRARVRVRERQRLRQRRSVESNTNVSATNMSESRGSENQASLEDVSGSERDYGTWSHGQMEPQVVPDTSSREASPDFGEVERERVRHIVRGWMESGISDPSPNVAQRSDSPRAEWLGETERERVRVVREWVQMTSQQRGARTNRREEQVSVPGAQVGGSREGSVTDHDDSQPEHIRRDMLRLRGRQAVIDLLVRIERERQRELQDIMEHRAVSDFAHRSRIQSLLRGRFLRNERPVEDEIRPSVATSELVQLRQRHTVSGLRNGFRSRLENIVRGQVSSHSEPLSNNNNTDYGSGQTHANPLQEVPHENQEQLPLGSQENDIYQQSENLEANTGAPSINEQDAANQGGDWQEQIIEDERENWQQATFNEFNEWGVGTSVNMDQSWQENSVKSWPQETSRNGEAGHPQSCSTEYSKYRGSWNCPKKNPFANEPSSWIKFWKKMPKTSRLVLVMLLQMLFLPQMRLQRTTIRMNKFLKNRV